MANSAPPTFGPDLFRFLRELERHNERPWFQANKERYENEVRAPALRFIETVGPGLARISRQLVADPRPVGGSLFRIYRDVRFSKDKSPYQTHVGMHFFHQGMKKGEGSKPGFYLHLSPGESFVAAGMWQPLPPELLRIRTAMVRDPAGWRRATAKGVELEGESLKRVPRGFDPEHPLAEDLKRKDFVASVEFSERQVLARGFDRRFLDACRQLDPLNRFLAKATGIAY